MNGRGLVVLERAALDPSQVAPQCMEWVRVWGARFGQQHGSWGRKQRENLKEKKKKSRVEHI